MRSDIFRTPWTRRAFVRHALRGGAALVAAPTVLATGVDKTASQPAHDKDIRLGVIGVGQCGLEHLKVFSDEAHPAKVRAVADVYEPYRKRATETAGEGCTAYADYRELLARSDIDAVIIATPDHWHALIAIEACRSGKDVYCETPLSRTIDEAFRIAGAARDTDVVFQTGSSMRVMRHVRSACDLFRHARAGELRRIEIGCGRGPTCGMEPAQSPPPGLDWDMWLGPAPWSDYTPKRCLKTFRWFYDYAGGTLTDTGVRYVNLALGSHPSVATQPVTIEPLHISFPLAGLFETAIDYELAYRFENGFEWRVSSDKPGIRFHTDKRWLFVDKDGLQASRPDILPGPNSIQPDASAPTGDDRLDWLDCIRTRRRPASDAHAGCQAAVLCHLGNIALRTGRTFRWDPAKARITDATLLNRWLTTAYRTPWHL